MGNIPHIPQQDDEQVTFGDDTDDDEERRLVKMVCTQPRTHMSSNAVQGSILSMVSNTISIMHIMGACLACLNRETKFVTTVPKRHSMHEVGMLQSSAQIVCSQLLPQEMEAGFRFMGKPTVAPCRLAGSAPHKSGGQRVKSWPDEPHKQTVTTRTHSIHMDVWHLSQTNKQATNLNQM